MVAVDVMGCEWAGCIHKKKKLRTASKELQLKYVELKHHIEKLRGATRNLRVELAETCRIQNEQNDHLLKIDIHLEHIESQY